MTRTSPRQKKAAHAATLPAIHRGAPVASQRGTNYSLTNADRDPALVARARLAAAQCLAGTIGTAVVSSTGATGPSAGVVRDEDDGATATVIVAPQTRAGRACAALHGDTGASSYRLSPADSEVAAQKAATAERWRSQLLRCETDLREVVSIGYNTEPSLRRTMKVLQLFDDVSVIATEHSPTLAELLRLFRGEFCHAIFSDAATSHLVEPTTGGLQAMRDGDMGAMDENDIATAEELHPYYDQVGSLQRENALLSSEVALGQTREAVAELRRQLAQSQENVKLYESEMGRLTRQNDTSVEQCRKARKELADYRLQAETQIERAEQELQALNVENKDMQLQLFRLRKQVAGGKAKLLKDSYRQMKRSKMQMMATLFSEGDERVSLLVMLSQLESRVNEALDSYDNEFVLTPDTSHAELQRKMGSAMSVLLEEMHLCEQHYHRLVPTSSQQALSETMDETDGYVAVLFDQKIYERLLARNALKARLEQLTLMVTEQHQQQAQQQQPQQPATPTATKTATTTRGEEGGKPGSAGTRTGAGAEPPGGPLPHLANNELHRRSSSRLTLVSFSASSPRDQRRGGESASLEEIVARCRQEWVDNIFGPSREAEVYRTASGVRVRRAEAQRQSAEMTLQQLLMHPLADLSSRKFFAGLDLFTGQDPIQQRYLCSINFIDPSIPVQMPEATNYIKLKVKSSLRDDRRVFEPTTAVVAVPAVTAGGGGGGAEDGHAAAGLSSPRHGLTSSSSASYPAPAEGRLTQGARIGSSGGYARQRGHSARAQGKRPSVARQLSEWGAKTAFVDLGDADDAAERERRAERQSGIFNVHENLRVFRELRQPSLLKESSTLQQRAGATSSTTAATVALQRLNPLSPNRSPEWTLYKALFGGYRSLTPRMLEVTTIDHILMNACSRHLTRMERRYEQCRAEAAHRSTNYQMLSTMAERFFRDLSELTDFQESLVDELEARYGFPELVAKNLYEMLCYLDAMATKDALLSLYLDVIRGFQPATHIHYICHTLYHLSYSWPTGNPTEEVSREDVLTVLRYLYRGTDRVVHVDIHEILKDFDMSTRCAAVTLVKMREYLAAVMLHQEEPLLLYFNGLFSSHCECETLNEISYDAFEQVVSKYWRETNETRGIVRFLATGLGFNRGPLLSARDLACVAAAAWCTNEWQ